MKKTLLSLTILTLSASAFAHIEPGVWVGVTPAGKDCSMEVFDQTFENGMAHPLNERIRLRVNGDEFKVYHPRAVDPKKGIVTFNHDAFEGVAPTPVGSNGIWVVMVHEKDREGPVSFRWIGDNWKTDQASTLTCENIKLRASFRRRK